jgi:MFS family permease
LLAAVPFLCNALQPPITYWLQRRFSLYQVILLGFVFNAMPWAFIWLLPWTGEHKHWIFALIVATATLSNSVCAVSWSAAMSDLVPLNIRGTYFGKRNLIFAFWTLVVVLTAGQIARHYDNSLTVFGFIFGVAAMARLCGMFFLTRMKFPAKVMERRPQTQTLADYLSVLKDRNYLWLMLFIGCWNMCINLGQPFYSKYVLDPNGLGMDMGRLTILTTISAFGGLLSLQAWGVLSDRFGNKPVMFTCALAWGLTALPAWLFAGPDRHVHLYANYFITGFMFAGFQLCQFTLMIKMVPPLGNAHYISVFLAFTSLLTALGPMVGGIFMGFLASRPSYGSLLGQPLLGYHLLFGLSLFAALLSLHILQQLREPAERPVGELVRQMRGMREFNPLIGLSSIAQYMFTPRGLTRFASDTARTLRRQTSALSDVGEELMEGGLRAVKGTFDRDRPDPPNKPGDDRGP